MKPKTSAVIAGLLAFSAAVPACAAESTAVTFRPQTIDAKIQIGYGLATADVDGDGKTDILLADAKEIVWYRNPGWEKFAMARGLTPKDNVCIAARDIDGDGKAEVAVGAEWNPGDTIGSGAVFYLDRPKDPTQLWRPIRLQHEPTTHRMHWIKDGAKDWLLAVLPLHGRGNQGGQGAGIQFLGYRKPRNIDGVWPIVSLNSQFHLAHNFDLETTSEPSPETLLMATKEGVQALSKAGDRWTNRAITQAPAGEVRVGRTPSGTHYLTTIEPMHGNQLAVYPRDVAATTANSARVSLDDKLIEGHALATGDLLGLGYDQIVVGWRGTGSRPGHKVGIKLFSASDSAGKTWSLHSLIDDNQMACEDLKLADLNGDGRIDVIAAGRSTKNVVIYWNETSAR